MWLSTTVPALLIVLWTASAFQRSPCFVARKNKQKTRLFTTSELVTNDITTSSVQADDNSITLVPLSDSPILLESSRPLLTEQECQLLRQHYEQGHSQESEALLARVHAQIDKLTGLPSHEQDCTRYVSYDPTSMDDDDELLPDGLHVDTNVEKLFRQVSCLLYLTTNEHDGATVFPVANNHDSALQRAAQSLLERNVHHTHVDPDSTETFLLEQAAHDVYHNNNSTTSVGGLRVLPRAGKLVVFCNILKNGVPDHMSFHGGEGNNREEKALITVFKEVPLDSFRSQQEFGQRVAATRQWLRDRYYPTKEG